MRRTMKKNGWMPLPSLVLGLLVAGCMMAAEDSRLPCSDSLDCPAGWICNTESGQCREPSSFDSIVDFELTPKPGSSAAPTQLASVDLRRVDDPLEIELDRAVPFSGWVHNDGPGVPGSLQLSRTPAFDSRRLSWNLQVAEDGTFDTELAYNAADDQLNHYQALFRPANRTDFPQLAASGIQLDAAGTTDASLKYPAYTPPDQLEQQQALLSVRLRVLESEAFPHPVSGILVEGITDQGLRTNLVAPDAQGWVVLELPVTLRPGGQEMLRPQSLTLLLRPAEANMRLPTVTTAEQMLVRLDPAAPDLGTFYVGDVPDSQAVTGVVTDSGGRPVTDCQLRFSAQAIGNGRYDKTIETDVEGYFSTTLPAGDYRVLVVPDPLAEVRLRAVNDVRVGPDAQPLSITLPPRLSLSGRVIDRDGAAVAGVLVRAERLADWNGLEDGVTRTFDGTSDDDGRFELLVDTGSYALTLIPPPASGLPRARLPNLVVSTDDIELEQQRTRLAAPEIIQGHLFNPGGSPVCGATVDVYRSDATSAELIGQTVSGTDSRGCNGSYSVVVPATAAELN